jgi:hypothetical protein
MFRDNLIDVCRLQTLLYEYSNCSYSLLHQVLGFWIRQWVNCCKSTKCF